MKSKKLIVIIVVVLAVGFIGYMAVRNTDHDNHDTMLLHSRLLQSFLQYLHDIPG
ncbi:MAG: hypothetical protein H8E17_04750, partial [Deltaproteobacteria bacterium]|nr:hypothetical protein [Deltaproteobacteria bacterium]